MGRLQKFLDGVKASRLLAPNLKEMTLKYYTGNKHRGNAIARDVVRDHLVALRWMNPNAVIYLREHRGQGTPEIDYELWTGGKKSMEIKPELAPEEVVAKVMMAARDPADDEAVAARLAAQGVSAAAAAAPPSSTPSSGASTVVPPTAGGAAPRAGARAFSTTSVSSAEAGARRRDEGGVADVFAGELR